ncbi:MAG TPA: nucleotidyl transferase AbiEii/AbiGii toxin family protein, partial [bacterium]
ESVDFDFFTPSTFNPDDLLNQLSERCDPKLNYKNKSTLGLWIEGITCTFFYYRYPLLKELKNYNAVRIVDAADIGAMKIAAISGRGKKRDFIDLYFVCQREYRLADIIKLYQKKYEVLDHDLYHIYNSLIYFNDAEIDAMPVMFEKTDWKEVKAFFENEIKQIMKN